MPAPLFNEALDDQVLLDACTDFRGGLNKSVAPHLLLPTEYSAAINGLVDITGALRTRGGTRNVSAASGCNRVVLTAFPTQSAKLLFFGNGAAKHTTLTAPDASAPSLTTELASPISVALGADRAYIQATADLWEYDGSHVYQTRALTLAIGNAGSGYNPATPPTVTVTPAVDEAVGRPYVAAEATATVATDGTIAAVNLINPGRGYTKAPSITIAPPPSGTTATVLVTMRTPPLGEFLCWHTNRLFSATGDTLNASDFRDGSYFPAANSIQIGAGDGQRIVGLASWDNFNLLVFKTQSVYLVITDPLQTAGQWQVQKLPGAVGGASHRSAVAVGADVWWLSPLGLVSVRRLMQETQREVNTAVSLPIDVDIRRINWAAAQASCTAYFDNKVFLALPLDGATQASHLFVYDTLLQKWVAEWQLPAAVVDMVVPYVGSPSLMFLLSDGRLVVYDTAQETDATTGGTTGFQTRLDLRGLAFGEPVLPKSLLNVTLEFSESETPATVSFRVDEGAFTDAWPLSATGRQLARIPFTLPVTLVSPGNLTVARTMPGKQFYYLQVRVQSASGVLRLRALKVSGFADTMVLAR